MKFVKKLPLDLFDYQSQSGYTSPLDEIDRALLSSISFFSMDNHPRTFSEIYSGFNFTYLDGSFPDQSDVALSLIHLIESDLVDVVK